MSGGVEGLITKLKSLHNTSIFINESINNALKHLPESLPEGSPQDTWELLFDEWDAFAKHEHQRGNNASIGEFFDLYKHKYRIITTEPPAPPLDTKDTSTQ